MNRTAPGRIEELFSSLVPEERARVISQGVALRKRVQLAESRVGHFQEKYGTTLEALQEEGLPVDADYEMHEDYVMWHHWERWQRKPGPASLHWRKSASRASSLETRFVLATERLLAIRERFGPCVARIVPVEFDGETLRLVLYLADGTNVRVTEAWRGEQLVRHSYYRLTADNNLRIGWHNAPHHNHLDTFPHHKHVQD